MNKRERIQWIKRVWRYLSLNATAAFAAKNEAEFDWYGEGQEVFWCVLNNKPVHITRRVKSL